MVEFKRTTGGKSAANAWTDVKPRGSASAAFISDVHLRADVPICRADSDYPHTVLAKLAWALEMAEKYLCPLIISGDLGHRAFWPNWLVNETLEIFINNPLLEGDRTIIIPGQHDLPTHRLDRIHESAIWSIDLGLDEVEVFNHPAHWMGHISSDFWIDLFPFGVEIDGNKRPKFREEVFEYDKRPRVAVAHQMVSNKPLPFEYTDAAGLLRKHPEFDLIVTGDNHKSFCVEYDGRKLLNPGSLVRQTADMADHEPSLFLWVAKTGDVCRVPYPYLNRSAVKSDHLTRKHERVGRLEQYIKTLRGTRIGVSFDANLKKACEDVEPDVVKYLDELMETIENGGTK